MSKELTDLIARAEGVLERVDQESDGDGKNAVAKCFDACGLVEFYTSGHILIF